jgi:arabinose-5-phosphate isomerase
MKNSNTFCETGKRVVEIEIDAITALKNRIDADFKSACETILNCQGRVIIVGMGKSGHIARKIAASMASTGTPAFYVHPGEASHGDLGMIIANDVVIAISYSGETEEVLKILPVIKHFSIPLIAICGKPKSSLGRAANAILNVQVDKEACTLGLAPTSSTTATLVMGDALAIAVLEARPFSSEDFAVFHPAGSLGRQLLMQVNEVMHKAERVPQVKPDCSLATAILEITNKALGMTTVLSDDKELLGIFTDGDLRRTLQENLDLHQTKIMDVMTTNCRTIPSETLAADALKLMNEKQITSIPITENDKVIGIVHVHDLLKVGIT